MLLAEIREALAGAIKAGVTAPLTVYPYVPDSVTPPCAYITPEAVAFDKAHNRGMDEITLTVTVYVSRGDDRASQELLDAFLAGAGPSSVKAAIESARGGPGEPALSGACHDVHVTGGRLYQWFTHADVRYLGAVLNVRCVGPGES